MGLRGKDAGIVEAIIPSSLRGPSRSFPVGDTIQLRAIGNYSNGDEVDLV